MIGVIVGVTVGVILFLGLLFCVWLRHKRKVQGRNHDHEVDMQRGRIQEQILSIAAAPNGQRTLEYLGLAGQMAAGRGNRAAITGGPYAGGGSAHILEVSLMYVCLTFYGTDHLL
jgi:hypothetical protein